MTVDKYRSLVNLNVMYKHQTSFNSYTFFFFFFLRRYNFREVLAFSTNSFHLVRFLMQSFQFIFILVVSLFTSSSHLFFGLPSDLVSAGDHTYTFFFYHAVVWHAMYVAKRS